MEEKQVANSLYHAYERVYGHAPNLNGDKRQLTIEFQAMVYFLMQYGVSFMRCGFVKEGYTSIDMPMSMGIQDILVGHMFGHDALEFSEEVIFNNYANKIMDILARELSYIKEDWGIRTIVKLHFAETRELPSSSAEKISAYTHVNLDAYKSYRTFLANILCELSKDNYDEVNLEQIRKEIEEGEVVDKSFRPVLDESGTGESPVISEKSRKIVASSLIR